MKNENYEKNVAVVIAKNAHRQLEEESRKRKLSAGEYLEMLIEMDYITPEEIAEMIISLSVEMLPERPISKRWFRSVVDVWGAADAGPEGSGNGTSR